MTACWPAAMPPLVLCWKPGSRRCPARGEGLRLRHHELRRRQDRPPDRKACPGQARRGGGQARTRPSGPCPGRRRPAASWAQSWLWPARSGENDHVLVLSAKKGCWLRTVPAADNAALWLLDMIRRPPPVCRRQRERASSPPDRPRPEPRRNPAAGRGQAPDTKEEASSPRPAGGALAAGAGGSGLWVGSHRRRPCRPSGAAEGPAPARVDHPLAGPRAEARCKTDIKHKEAASRRRVGRRPRFYSTKPRRKREIPSAAGRLC